MAVPLLSRAIAYTDAQPCTGYMFSGHSQPEVTFRANAIKTTAKGARMLHFSDGTRIDITYPAYYMKGKAGLVVILLHCSSPES